ncbi:unnamed protein product [Arabidopsis lyrata]|uniref:GCK domain-containing protein n=1 Tax=Arabidopsis lyrata subsp. lyrata TaxID=81972 RepID=D7M792_ARALL|nr:hypothetical protein ARALYDRAFT_324894 [Arabidopsis lyrata subsp. lyrata]CAH8269775.1 unnamed protein product [Arabidopsis lyrata]
MGIISSTVLKLVHISQNYNQVVDSSSGWQNQFEVFMKGDESLVKTFLPSTTVSLNEINEDEDEKFVEFMKGGGCKESYTAWHDDCNFTEEEAEKNKDLVTKCAGLFGKLSKCLDVHSDYYHPILAVRKTTEEHLEKELAAFFAEGS